MNGNSINRLNQITLILSTVLGSWLGMQAAHELGHVLGARLTGGRVACVVLHPLTISRTDLAENPNPGAVAWAGPVVGVLGPLTLWGVAVLLRIPGVCVLRFFAGFCLIANGAYLAVGSFLRAGDCGEMLRLGSPIWQLWLFGLATVPLGLWLWHRQGAHFGLGRGEAPVKPAVAYGSLATCAGLVVLELLVGGE